MHKGITFFPTEYSIRPDEIAAACEERGFESMWVAEHSHIPESPATPGPPDDGQPGLPREYYSTADPFVSLALAAAATKTLKLATGICLVPQRDVFLTAKQVATLDLYSGGRFLFGIGAGWNQPEIENHGTPFKERFGIMRERVAAMKVLWRQEKGEYHGRWVDFAPAYSWPKPVQKPHPPVHVGGAGLPAIRRTIRYGDGWVPLASEDAVNDPVALMPRLRALADEAGRDGSAIEVSIYFCPPTPEKVEHFQRGGITRVLFPVPSAPRDTVLPILDQYAALV